MKTHFTFDHQASGMDARARVVVGDGGVRVMHVLPYPASGARFSNWLSDTEQQATKNDTDTLPAWRGVHVFQSIIASCFSVLPN